MKDVIKIFLALAAGVTVCWAGKWSYSGNSGPQNWHTLFPEACGGKRQSPLDLKVEQTMYDPKLREFAIWYDPPKPDSKMIIENNGHTVQVNLHGDFFVANGGLTDEFRATQFHFHWGHKASQGSEHLFDGTASPIEMHVVSYNKNKYADIGQAVTEPDGLAVLGVMFKISEEDNPKFEPIVRALKFIRDPDAGSKVQLPLMSLRGLLPRDIRRYYRYQGSLTTPGCFESVTWTVFHDMQTISKRQMGEFRKLLQFRRLHKHHKESEHSRSRRSMTREEKKMEHRAEKVLDELGIKGDQVEETVLANKVTKMREAQEAQQAHDSAGAQMPAVVEGGTEGKADDSGHVQKPTEEPSYRQGQLVNNFRPVQPIGDRVVYRSFELREVFYREFEESQVAGIRDSPDGQWPPLDQHAQPGVVNVDGHKGHGHGHGHGDGDGATGLGASVTVLVTCLLCLVVRNLAL